MPKASSIVFINQNSGYLMIDIIKQHQKKFDKIVLVCGRLIQRNNLLDTAVKVEKIVQYDRSSSWKRLFTWTWGFIQILYLVKTRHRYAELYIVSNPPLATLLPLFCKNKFHLLVFDVYPDALVEYRILKPTSFIVRTWRKMNRRIYRRAANVFTLSQGMRRLLARYLADERIQVVSIWTDNSFLKPVSKNVNAFVLTHRLVGKFIVMYSGNLGRTHDVEVLIDCAARMADSNVMFVVIGEGEKRQMLEQKMKDNRVENFLLLPLQDVDTFPLSLAAADLGVVTLGKQASLLSVPSKTYNLLSVGAPLLCIASEESELSSLVSHYELGKCFDAIEVDAIVEFIEKVASDTKLHQKLRSNALNASKAFGPENALKLVV